MAEVPALCTGIVVRNDDPDKRSRVILKVPAALGNSPSNWAEPLVPSPYIPQVDEVLWVMFADGDLSRPVYTSSILVAGATILAGTITTEHLNFTPTTSEDIAGLEDDVQTALDGITTAETAATNSATSAAAAAVSASNAETSAGDAETAATAAAGDADAAATSASSADTAATNSATSAGAAATSASNAATSASSANTAATNSATSASQAATSASTAASYAAAKATIFYGGLADFGGAQPTAAARTPSLSPCV